MNAKDKEAFDNWRNGKVNRPDIYDAWESACEYMQAELAHHIFMIEAENKKLREALEFYANPHSYCYTGSGGGASGHRYRVIPSDREEISPEWNGILVAGKRAREALKEIEE